MTVDEWLATLPGDKRAELMTETLLPCPYDQTEPGVDTHTTFSVFLGLTDCDRCRVALGRNCSNWYTMQSAPRDGTIIVITRLAPWPQGCMATARFEKEPKKGWRIIAKTAGNFYDFPDSHIWWPNGFPSSWMPLPGVTVQDIYPLLTNK